MKKFFVFALLPAMLTACGGSESKSKTEEPKVVDISQNPDYQKGLELASKSDCFTCHQIDEKLTGPSYRDVANKYASMPDTIVAHLAGKIITGGSGVWGQIMMTPHPALNQADAEAIVKYILLLKK